MEKNYTRKKVNDNPLLSNLFIVMEYFYGYIIVTEYACIEIHKYT